MAVTSLKGFKKVVFFPSLNTPDADGFPTFSTPIVLGSASAINDISLTLTPTRNNIDYKADDEIESEETIASYTGTLTLYNLTDAQKKALFDYEEDSQHNLLQTTDKAKKVGALFFEYVVGTTTYQKYLLNVTIKPNEETYNTYDGTNPSTYALPIVVSKISYKDKSIFAETIADGNTGFVTGTPTTVYKPVFTEA